MSRHREAAVSSAAVNEVVAQYGSFDAYLRSFGSPEEEIAGLPHRFAGLGGYLAWWFMQSVGLPELLACTSRPSGGDDAS